MKSLPACFPELSTRCSVSKKRRSPRCGGETRRMQAGSHSSDEAFAKLDSFRPSRRNPLSK